MTIGEILSAVVPIVVVIVGGWFGLKQAVKVANRNAKSQSEQLNLQTFQALNSALKDEVDRLRKDREEDQDRAAKDLSAVTDKLTANQEACEALRRKLVKMEAWTGAIINVIQHPAVMAAVKEHGLIIPPPPLEE